MLQSRLPLRQHDVFTARKPRPARLPVQSRHLLGSRATLGQHIRPEVRQLRKERLSSRTLGVVSTTTFSSFYFLSTSSQEAPVCDVGAVADDAQHRTLLTSSAGLDNAKKLVTAYKTGKIPEMTPELWKAKKIIDSTIHPGTTTAQWHNMEEGLTKRKIRESQSSYPSACHALS